MAYASVSGNSATAARSARRTKVATLWVAQAWPHVKAPVWFRLSRTVFRAPGSQPSRACRKRGFGGVPLTATTLRPTYVLQLARFTLLEAVSRRLILAGCLISLGYLGLFTLG